MIYYRAKDTFVIDQDGKQIAVILPTNCTKKAAREMAAYCAEKMNHIERRKAAKETP